MVPDFLNWGQKTSPTQMFSFPLLNTVLDLSIQEGPKFWCTGWISAITYKYYIVIYIYIYAYDTIYYLLQFDNIEYHYLFTHELLENKKQIQGQLFEKLFIWDKTFPFSHKHEKKTKEIYESSITVRQ